MVVRTKKRRKSKAQRGQTTYGHGARKKWKGSGHRGGKGMAGSGKRADQKKTLVNKLYGGDYFGKTGITSMHTRKKTHSEINLKTISDNFDSLMKKFGKNGKLILKKYRVLGDGEISQKVTIVCEGITKSAKEKIENAGGKVELSKKEDKKEC
jgi:large subunit ribosomal protein L15